jgi:hypothetical protein
MKCYIGEHEFDFKMANSSESGAIVGMLGLGRRNTTACHRTPQQLADYIAKTKSTEVVFCGLDNHMCGFRLNKGLWRFLVLPQYQVFAFCEFLEKEIEKHEEKMRKLRKINWLQEGF